MQPKPLLQALGQGFGRRDADETFRFGKLTNLYQGERTNNCT